VRRGPLTSRALSDAQSLQDRRTGPQAPRARDTARQRRSAAPHMDRGRDGSRGKRMIPSLCYPFASSTAALLSLPTVPPAAGALRPLWSCHLCFFSAATSGKRQQALLSATPFCCERWLAMELPFVKRAGGASDWRGNKSRSQGQAGWFEQPSSPVTLCSPTPLPLERQAREACGCGGSDGGGQARR
jgi:hypothetical protein